MSTQPDVQLYEVEIRFTDISHDRTAIVVADDVPDAVRKARALYPTSGATGAVRRVETLEVRR